MYWHSKQNHVETHRQKKNKGYKITTRLKTMKTKYLHSDISFNATTASEINAPAIFCPEQRNWCCAALKGHQ